MVNLIIQFVTLIIALFFLVKSSDLVSDAAVKISKITKLGEMAVGFLLLSIITSLPELAVTFSAIRSGDPAISIGGLFGSNIANIGLILGLTVILAPTTVRIIQESYKNISLMIFLAALPPILLLPFSSYGAPIGWLLLFIFLFFCFYSIKTNTNLKDDGEMEVSEKVKGNIRRSLLIMLGGLVVVILSAQFVVDSAVYISGRLGIAESVIGATIIAIGTSLPELSVSLSAVRKNHMNLALGNILGSCIVNLTLLLGLVFALSSLALDLTIYAELILFLLVANFALWRMVLDGKIGLGAGIILLMLYLFFMASTFGLQVMILSPEYLFEALGFLTETVVTILSYSVVAIVMFSLGWSLKKN